jgi:hypothetical protein
MEIEGAADGRSGAVTVVQRTSADLKLHPHLHAVLLDGVFLAGPGGGDSKPVFHTLPCISDTAVADLLQIIRARLMRFLVRRRVVEADGDTLLLAEDLEQRDPALAQLAAAAVAGLPPAGPELRRKPLTVFLPAGSGPKVVRHLCVEDAGFSLHAATRAGAEDEVGRTNLFKYVLNLDVETCPRCGGKMKLIALVQDAESIARYLRHLGLPTEVPPVAPARGPPFWQSRVLRRRYGEPPDAA